MLLIIHWLFYIIHNYILTLTILTQPPEQNSEATAGSVLKNFANSTGKHLCWSLFLKTSMLVLAGLGRKRVGFLDKNENQYFFQETLEKNFPKLKKLKVLLHYTVLHQVGQGGYSLEWFRKSCSVGSSSTLYVVPVQKYLDLGLTDEEQVRKIIPLDFF